MQYYQIFFFNLSNNLFLILIIHMIKLKIKINIKISAKKKIPFLDLNDFLIYYIKIIILNNAVKSLTVVY